MNNISLGFRMNRNPLLKQNDGQSILEFALIIPILLLIVFGIIDFGRLAYHKSLMNQATKEAARMASIGRNINTIAQRIAVLTEPLTGSVSTGISNGSNDEGKPCTKIILTPSSTREVMTATIAPIYQTTLKQGDSLRIAITYRFIYITPLFSSVGSTAMLKETYYTVVENPPA